LPCSLRRACCWPSLPFPRRPQPSALRTLTSDDQLAIGIVLAELTLHADR